MSNKPKTPIKHILAVLKMPVKMGDKIGKAGFIQSKLTGNPNFPLPYPVNVVSLAQLGTDMAALGTAQTAVKNHAPGAAETRNAALNVVVADLRSIMTMVQGVADKTPANSETIILGAGYDVKKVSPRQKQTNNVVAGKVSGTVIISADSPGAHEYQMSKDQINIINLPSVSKAKTTVNGLNPGDVWYFRNRPILKKNQTGNWSAWLKFMIV